MSEQLDQKLEYLGNALLRLEEGINTPVGENRLNIDGSIQRFESCIEAFWKTLRLVLETLGRKAVYPKDVLMMSYEGGLINDEEVWLRMLDDRNETSHNYKPEVADRIYSDIKSIYFSILQATFVKLKEKAQSETDRISIKP